MNIIDHHKVAQLKLIYHSITSINIIKSFLIENFLAHDLRIRVSTHLATVKGETFAEAATSESSES